jgi:hypothetical protein
MICQELGCKNQIEESVDNCCGQQGTMNEGDEDLGCGRFFCKKHLYVFPQLFCGTCQKGFFKEFGLTMNGPNKTLEEA